MMAIITVVVKLDNYNFKTILRGHFCSENRMRDICTCNFYLRILNLWFLIIRCIIRHLFFYEHKYLIRYIKAVTLIIKNCKHSFVLQKIKIRKNHKIILKH